MPDPLPRDQTGVRLADLIRQPGYPDNLYDLLAASGRPVAYDRDLGLWIIHRRDDVRRALTDTNAYSNALTLMPVYQPCPDAMDILGKLDAPPTTAAADNPTHRRTRTALRDTFPNTAERVAEQYGHIVDFRVDQLTTLVESRFARRRWNVVDLVADYTSQLPLWVICDIIGIPGSDIPRIQAWADGQTTLVWGFPDQEEQIRLAQGLLDFWRYTQEHVAARERLRLLGDAVDDWTGKALAYRDGNDTILTLDEVASLAFNLLVAGHETTAGLIAHAIDAALTIPGKWQALAAGDASITDHVERTLRCRPPIDAWLRYTLTDVDLGNGVTIPSAQRVLALIGAANREDGELLSFGKGPHYCIGAALARLEAVTALTALTRRLPGLRLKPGWKRRYKPNVAFRAHEDLLAVVA
jgi:cytochrome P450